MSMRINKLNKDKRQVLFDLLIRKGFKHTINDKNQARIHVFTKGKNILAFSEAIYIRHMIAVRMTLYMNNIMSMRTFHNEMNIEQVDNSYFWKK